MWWFYGQKYVLIHIMWKNTFDSIYCQPYHNQSIDYPIYLDTTQSPSMDGHKLSQYTKRFVTNNGHKMCFIQKPILKVLNYNLINFVLSACLGKCECQTTVMVSVGCEHVVYTRCLIVWKYCDLRKIEAGKFRHWQKISSKHGKGAAIWFRGGEKHNYSVHIALSILEVETMYSFYQFTYKKKMVVFVNQADLSYELIN